MPRTYTTIHLPVQQEQSLLGLPPPRQLVVVLMKADSLPPDPRTRSVALAAVAVAAVILAGLGFWFYQAEKGEITHKQLQALTAVGELKARQIQQWRKERVAEVERTAKDGQTRKAISVFLADPASPNARRELQQCLREEVTEQDSGTALLFDVKGNLLASTDDAVGPADEATRKAIGEALSGNKGVVSDFYRTPDNVVHIDFAASVPDEDQQPQAVLILRHEAKNYLYPLLQEWPVPSRSAETLLTQRDGDEVVFLSQLRHRGDPPLSLRHPLSDAHLPGVQAALGKQGIFEGKDYRGVDVVSVLVPVAGSPWLVTAKVDAEEIFAEARYHAGVISLVVGLLILLAAGLVAYVYRKRQAGILNDLVKAEQQKAEAQKRELDVARHHRTILQTAMDGFCIVDSQGRIRKVNDAYCQMTGYSEAELLTMRVADLEADESADEAASHLQKIVAEGQDRFESRQWRKDGSFLDVEVSAQFKPAEGVLVAFLRDITERKRVESQLVRSEQMLRSSQETARIGHYVMDLVTGLWESSPTLDRLFGIDRDFVRNTDGWRSLLHTEDREKAVSYLLRCLKNRETFRMDYRIIRPTDGELRWMAGYGDFEYDDSDKAVRFVGCIQDITVQKAAEAKIKRLSVLYAALSECSQAIVRSKSSDELLERVCRIVVDQGEMKLAWIGMADASGGVRVQAAYGPGIGYLEGIRVTWNAGDPLGRGPTGTAIREGKPFWCHSFMSDARTAPWQERADRFGWKSTASIPLHLRGKTIGALTIYDDVSEVFDDDVRRLFIEMEKTISFALDYFATENERERGEVALRESEERLRAITDSAQDAILMMGPDGGICFWNTAAERIFGHSSTEALGKNLHALITPPRYHAAHHAAFPAFLKTGKGNAVGKTLDMEALRKDGSEISVQLSLSAIHIHGEWHAVWVIRDITEQKRVDEELRRSESRFRKYFELPLHGRSITSPKKGWMEVNDRLCEILGYSREEILGKTWAEMTHPGDLAAEVTQFDRIVSGEIEQYKLEKRFIRKNGSPVWTEISVGCVRNPDGTVDHFICVMEDISERKAIEDRLKDALDRAEAGSRAKSEFLAIMSHELRTPLNGVLGFADLLADTDLDEEQEAFAMTIRKSGTHLLAIVNDILDFSSIEKGTLSIHAEPLAVADLVKESERAVLKSAMEKEIALQSAIEPGTPEQILGDGQRIRQILINLLGNAVKFTSSGSVTIRVAVASGGGGRFLDFSVEDTGIGISPETIKILFEPFMQAEMKLNRKFGGTGLGLAISQRLAEAMGGNITVISSAGRGSTFTFRLPMDTPAACGAISPNPDTPVTRSNVLDDAASGAEHPPSGRPVLVVEDDNTNSMLAGKMLQMLGYHVEFAADGAEALAAFSPGKYSVILMDIQMPVMNGIEAAKKIRELESGTHVPIIALTAKVMPGDRERCLEAGMDDFLAKPFTRAELASKLAGATRRL